MTHSTLKKAKNNRRARILPGEWCFGCFTLFCLCLILRNSELAIEYMSRGILLCTGSVIPSLFPFMVLSELIVTGKVAPRLLGRFSKPLGHLLGLSETGVSAFLAGLVCGFPVGARCATVALQAGQISKNEAEQILLTSSVPSSAFLISAVGISLWENKRFGILLYVTSIFVSVAVGILRHFLRGEKKGSSLTATLPFPLSNTPPIGAQRFTNAIRNATKSIALVCAYVLFFSALGGTLGLLLTQLSLPSWCEGILFALLELSSGMSYAASLSHATVGALLSAFAAGWAGLSVHCQILSLCDGHGISFRSYFLTKLLHGILCALAVGLLVYLFPGLLMSGAEI